MIKPITKKYHNKDLNIAYNDGFEKGKAEAIKEVLEIVNGLGIDWFLASTPDKFKKKLKSQLQNLNTENKHRSELKMMKDIKYERIVETKESYGLWIGFLNSFVVMVLIIMGFVNSFEFWSGLFLGLNFICAVANFFTYVSKDNRTVYYRKFTLERGTKQ